ncbi:hypothetical protein [Microbispora sp. H11081]|uniref:hypothetical protein n=1 Tax=Microbispora sp. H11081 TaxID=2729107 RepID=UPI0014751EAB|nr:hypothetical protein [Microbispora sp. H11081]
MADIRHLSYTIRVGRQHSAALAQMAEWGFDGSAPGAAAVYGVGDGCVRITADAAAYAMRRHILLSGETRDADAEGMAVKA